MMFPYILGISGEEHDAFVRAIERLEGDGYAKGEDTKRGAEILAWAYAAAIGSNAITRAQREMFLRLTTEMIREWGIELRLPNDASGTIAFLICSGAYPAPCWIA